MLSKLYKTLLVIAIINSIFEANTIADSIKTSTLQDYTSTGNNSFINMHNKVYYFGQSPVNWFKATLICRTMKSHLASFSNAQQLADVAAYLAAQFPRNRNWWLSGSDLEMEGDFHWYSSGQRFTYADWAKGQPNNYEDKQHCVYLTWESSVASYRMADNKCEALLYFICEGEKRNKIVLNLD